MSRRWVDLGCILLLLTATFLLYRKATRLWWTYDDAYLLHIAVGHDASDHFVGTSIWRSMPQQLFTPLLTATYDAQLSLFGLHAGSYYTVHIILLALTAVALFGLLRLWLAASVSLSACLLFLAGPPLCAIATQLMVVHYSESVLLAIVSASIFTISLRSGSKLGSGLSALFYLAAMLAKEVAVPLPAGLLLIPDRDARTRGRALLPHLIAIAVYAALRWRALQTLFGGYGWAVTASEVPGLLVSTPVRILGVMAGANLVVGGTLLAVIAVAVVVLLRRHGGAAAVLVAIVLSVAPIFPMAKEMQKRFAFVPWLACSMLFAAGASAMRSRLAARTLLMAAPLLALTANRQEWGAEYRRALRMSAEARAFFDLGAGDLLRKPSVPPAAMGELKWLKETHVMRPAGAGWFYDDIYLCKAGASLRRVVEYEPDSRAVREVTMAAVDEARKYCASIRNEAALWARFRFADDALFWEFGPYERGEYGVVIAGGLQAFVVPRRDGFRLPGVPSLALRVRYRAPEGWVTYSPEIDVPLREGGKVEWRR